MSWNVRNLARALSMMAIGIVFVTVHPGWSVSAAEPNLAQGRGNDAAPGQGRGNGTGGGRGTGGGGGRGTGGGTAAQGKAVDAAALKLETVKGEVVQVGETEASGEGKGSGNGAGARSGPMIRVRTEKETLSVHAGAPHFRQEQKLDLEVGDAIEISGVRSAQNPSMLVAYSITRGSQVVRLRDQQGQKLWKPRQRAQEPEIAQINARIVSLDVPATHSPGSGLGRRSQFIFVRADKEELAIEVGPEDYRQAQGLAFRVDDELTISGWRLPSAQTGGKPIVLASSITKGKTVVKLRDERRRPLWGKKK